MRIEVTRATLPESNSFFCPTECFKLATVYSTIAVKAKYNGKDVWITFIAVRNTSNSDLRVITARTVEGKALNLAYDPTTQKLYILTMPR